MMRKKGLIDNECNLIRATEEANIKCFKPIFAAKKIRVIPFNRAMLHIDSLFAKQTRAILFNLAIPNYHFPLPLPFFLNGWVKESLKL